MMCLHVLVRSLGFSCFEVACILGKSCQHRKLLWHSAAGVDLESLIKTSGCAETIWRAVLKAMLTIINRFSFHPILFRIHNFLCERERVRDVRVRWRTLFHHFSTFFGEPFPLSGSFCNKLFAIQQLLVVRVYRSSLRVLCEEKEEKPSRYDMFTMLSVFAYSSEKFSFLASESLFT